MLKKPDKVLALLLIAVGAVGVFLLIGGGDTHCTFASQVFAQLRLCGSEYAAEVRELRVVPVAFFVGLFGAGPLLVTR